MAGLHVDYLGLFIVAALIYYIIREAVKKTRPKVCRFGLRDKQKETKETKETKNL